MRAIGWSEGIDRVEWGEAIARAWSNPRSALTVITMYSRGWCYRFKYKALGRRVLVGRRLRVSGRLDISGPGIVIFGDDCTAASSYLAPVTPYTHSPQATIRFGNRVVLNGTRLGCMQRIEVGDNCLLADARIMDSDFHALDGFARHRWQTSGVTKPVIIGPNVWICAGAMVLKGVTIGANSVVAAGSIVTRDVPPNVVVAGNPARVVRRLEPPAGRTALGSRGHGHDDLVPRPGSGR